jgi:hypothetical protein
VGLSSVHFFPLVVGRKICIHISPNKKDINTINLEIPGAVSAAANHGHSFDVSFLFLIGTMGLIYSQSHERIISPQQIVLFINALKDKFLSMNSYQGQILAIG